MWLTRVIGVALIAAGVLGFVYGKFSYTKETHEASVAGLELALKEKETVRIPPWVNAGAIGIGALLLLLGKRK